MRTPSAFVAPTTPRSRGFQRNRGRKARALGADGLLPPLFIVDATLALVHAAGHTAAYLDADEERTVLQTSGGVTTRGSSPAPTYETLLSFLRDTLGA
jgi:hypothetical protein